MKYRLHALIVLTSIFLFTACATTKVQSPSEVILGKWNLDAQGMSLVVNITDTELELEGMGMSFDYKWLDDKQVALSGPAGNMTAMVEVLNSNQFTLTTQEQGIQTLNRVMD